MLPARAGVTGGHLHAGAPVRPHRAREQSHQAFDVVIPTEVIDFSIDCAPQAHLVTKGHRLMLQIASSHPDKVPTFAEGAQITIYSGGQEGTSVSLPVIFDPKTYADPLGPLALQ